MGSKTDAFENTILDHILGAQAWTPPATVYIALFTAAPSDSSAGTECTGGSYARVAVTNNLTNWPAASSGNKKNATPIVFPTPTGSWGGNVVGMAIFDAASGGNMLYWTTVTSKAITTGEPVYFAANSISVTEG